MLCQWQLEFYDKSDSSGYSHSGKDGYPHSGKDRYSHSGRVFGTDGQAV